MTSEDLLAQLLQQQQSLTDAIATVLAQLQADRNEDKWVPLEEGASALGPAFSARKIRDDIDKGHLKLKAHYIDTSNGNRPNYAVKVRALRRFYESPPESR